MRVHAIADLGRAPGPPGGRGLSAALAPRRPDRGRRDLPCRPLARRAGHPGHARRAARPLAQPGRAALLFAAIRREACRLRRRTDSILWRIEPRLAPPLPPYLRGFVRAPVDLDPFETNEVDLSGGMAGVLARMTSKGRYNVGLARRHGVEVEVTTDPASAARFHPLLAETAARQGFAAEPLCYLMDLAATLFPARMAAAFFATYRGETLAAAIAVFFGPRATYLYGASRREHREVMAPSALQAAIMASAIDRGCTTYDLYGIDAQGDRADHAYRRLSQFKRQFGGREPRLRRRTRPVQLRPDRRCDAPLPAAPSSRGGTRESACSVILHTTFVAAGLMVAWNIS